MLTKTNLKSPDPLAEGIFVLFLLQREVILNKTKDWALVQNATYVIKIKDLKGCLR